MKITERRCWIFLALVVVAFGVVWAAETAPFIVTGSTGVPVHVLHSSGYIQNAGARANAPKDNWHMQAADGTVKAGWNAQGAPILTDTDTVSSTLLDGTVEVTVTFGKAEYDTNYYIIGTLAGSSAAGQPVGVARKTTTGFTINNRAGSLTTPFAYTWFKIRTTTSTIP